MRSVFLRNRNDSEVCSFIAWIFLVYCMMFAFEAHAGVEYDHPTPTKIESPSGVNIYAATVYLDNLEMEDCQNNITTVPIKSWANLDSGFLLTLPEGSCWQSATLTFDSLLSVEGAISTGDLDLLLALPSITFTPPQTFSVSTGGSASALLLIGFPDADFLNLIAEDGLVGVQPGSAAHDDLVAEMVFLSGWLTL